MKSSAYYTLLLAQRKYLQSEMVITPYRCSVGKVHSFDYEICVILQDFLWLFVALSY